MAADKLLIVLSSLLLLSPLVLSQIGPFINPDKYISTFRSSEPAFKDLMDDLAGAMEIAERFKDIDYDYEPEHLWEAINRDGRNGTRELVDAFNDLMGIIEVDVERALEMRP